MTTDSDIVREALRKHPNWDCGCPKHAWIGTALAALDRLAAIQSAADWLVANRGHRGEAHAWELLTDALAKEPK